MPPSLSQLTLSAAAAALALSYTATTTLAQTNDVTSQVTSAYVSFARNTNSPSISESVVGTNAITPLAIFKAPTSSSQQYAFTYVSNGLSATTAASAFTSNGGVTPVSIGLALIDSADYPLAQPANALYGQLLTGAYSSDGSAVDTAAANDFNVIIPFDSSKGQAQCVQYNNGGWDSSVVTTTNSASGQVTCGITQPNHLLTIVSTSSATSAPSTTTAATATPAATTTIAGELPSASSTSAPTTSASSSSGSTTTAASSSPSTEQATTVAPTTSPATAAFVLPGSLPSVSGATTAAASSTSSPSTTSAATTAAGTTSAASSSSGVGAIPSGAERVSFSLYNLTEDTVSSSNYQSFVTQLGQDMSSVFGVNANRFSVASATWDQSSQLINVLVDILPASSTTTNSRKLRLNGLVRPALRNKLASHQMLTLATDPNASPSTIASELAGVTSSELTNTVYLQHINVQSLKSCSSGTTCDGTINPISLGSSGNSASSSSTPFLDSSRYLWVPIVVAILGAALLAILLFLCIRYRRKQKQTTYYPHSAAAVKQGGAVYGADQEESRLAGRPYHRTADSTDLAIPLSPTGERRASGAAITGGAAAAAAAGPSIYSTRTMDSKDKMRNTAFDDDEFNPFEESANNYRFTGRSQGSTAPLRGDTDREPSMSRMSNSEVNITFDTATPTELHPHMEEDSRGRRFVYQPTR